MAIDLTSLLGGAATGTMSPLAMYKKLQKTAEQNRGAQNAASEQEKAKAITRDLNNAAIRLRNSLFTQENARVKSDADYFKSRAATATSVSDLISDDRFLKVLATANGFQDLYIKDRQRLRDILTSNLNDPTSVARQGGLKELELAKKFNFGATGNQLDSNGNTVGLTADGKIANDGTVATPLPAGLAKLRGLAVDMNGTALVDGTGKLQKGADWASMTANSYQQSQTKALLQEEKAPEKSATSGIYEFAGEEFDRFRQRSDVQREVEYYRENIQNIKSVDDLFKDYRLTKFLLSAYDLESEAQYPGKVRKIIESDLADVDSLANRFQDPRFRQLTEDLSIHVTGVTKLKFQSTTDDVIRRYERLAYERHLDTQAPGVRAAIEFGRRIKDVNKTVQILGDSVLREVVTVAHNIPKQIAYQEVGSQVTALEKKFDIKTVKGDQSEIEKTVMRYLTFKDQGGIGGPQSYLLNLLG